MDTALLKIAGFAAADAAMMTGVDLFADNPVDPMENLLIVASYYSIAMLPAERMIREKLDENMAFPVSAAAKVAYIAGVKMLVNLSEGRKLNLGSALVAAGSTSITRSLAHSLQ